MLLQSDRYAICIFHADKDGAVKCSVHGYRNNLIYPTSLVDSNYQYQY